MAGLSLLPHGHAAHTDQLVVRAVDQRVRRKRTVALSPDLLDTENEDKTTTLKTIKDRVEQFECKLVHIWFLQ